jgi:ABC-2 type transport system ATP-binding protein
MIEISMLNKTYKRKKVLKDISFTAEKGQITCLIGINGAGKTTILKSIMGLTPIDSGQVLVDGEKVTPKTYEKVTYIPDRLTMIPSYTIEQAFQFMKDFYIAWNEERAYELLHFFKLNKNDKISTLSKGNSMKVNMLLGLALDVDYLLMDEPFSGIDMFSREQITDVFSSHLIEGRGVIITTHEIQDIEHLIDKAVLLGDGIVIKEMNVERVREFEGKSVVDVMREVYAG